MGREPIDISRRSPARESKKLILIVYTGVLEESYFRSILDKLGGYPATLRASDAAEADLAAVVQVAHLTSLQERRKGSAFDEVWCVVSGGATASEEPAVDRARRAGIRVARSDPSFDLWLVLHFLDISDPAAPEELKVLREKHLGEDIAALDDLHETATRRATALRTLHAAQDGVGNPSTDVDLLVASMYESMREFLKENEL